jgi:hypothetical protein
MLNILQIIIIIIVAFIINIIISKYSFNERSYYLILWTDHGLLHSYSQVATDTRKYTRTICGNGHNRQRNMLTASVS